MKLSRGASFAIVGLIYLIASVAGFLTGSLLRTSHPLLLAFAADVAATLIVWLCGVAFGNSSVYDPYWSAAPAVIAVCWALELPAFGIVPLLLLMAVFTWSARLTLNWAVRWRGLGHEDWRYVMYKRRMPRLWFLVNLFGINLMPTVLVFLALAPARQGMLTPAPAGPFVWTGFCVCALAITLELVADRQMDAYRRQPGNKSPYIAEGLWLLCRHPNYLGEVLFWWGIWLMSLNAGFAAWTLAGPSLITLLFVFISIPMMEKHILESRPEYARYIRAVPMLLPLPGKEKGRARPAPTDY